MSPEVSFVVTVYDKAWALPRVWSRLRDEPGGAALEFVFVDDASGDGSRARLRDIAADDRRVRLVLNDENRGPAVRLNQGAAAASGRLLYLIDGDDLAPRGAALWARDRLAASRLRMLWGRRRADAGPRIAADAATLRVDDALAFCARRPVVHMAGVVERDLFREAGGADEAVFIQDQSTPLRLARAAGAMLWTEAALASPLDGAGGLSTNRIQQHHDRFLAARRMLDGAASPTARAALAELAVSALWKARRDAGPGAHVSPAFARYLAAKALGRRPDGATLDRWGADLRRRPEVRRA